MIGPRQHPFLLGVGGSSGQTNKKKAIGDSRNRLGIVLFQKVNASQNLQKIVCRFSLRQITILLS